MNFANQTNNKTNLAMQSPILFLFQLKERVFSIFTPKFREKIN